MFRPVEMDWVRMFGKARPISRRVHDGGLTLIEVMVAILVLAAVVIGAAAFFSTGRGVVEQAAQRRTAAQVAKERNELARAGGYDALSSGSDDVTLDGVTYTWTLTVTAVRADPADSGSTYKQMSMVVDWPMSRGNPVTVPTAMAP